MSERYSASFCLRYMIRAGAQKRSVLWSLNPIPVFLAEYCQHALATFPGLKRLMGVFVLKCYVVSNLE